MSEHRITRSTARHHRTDYPFCGLLAEDFGIPLRDIEAAFIGVPSVPKKQAIQICEWAVRVCRDSYDAGDAIRRWARKRGVGSYNEALLNGPENTYGEGV